MATLINRQPAKVPPIDRRKGLFLKLVDRIGKVPKKITIMKNESIKRIFKRERTASVGIDISNLTDYMMTAKRKNLN